MRSPTVHRLVSGAAQRITVSVLGAVPFIVLTSGRTTYWIPDAPTAQPPSADAACVTMPAACGGSGELEPVSFDLTMISPDPADAREPEGG